MAKKPKSTQLSITLPPQAVEMIHRLQGGLYGKGPAEICRSLIVDKLKEIFPEGRLPPPTR